MKVLLATGADVTRESVEELFSGNKNGCTELVCCSLDRSPERAAQVRPDVVLIDVGGNTQHAWQTIAEVEEAQPVRTVALGPSDNAQLILETLNQGVYRYVGLERIDEELPNALRRLRAEPPLAVQRGRVIAAVGVCGGCGTSTLAVNIAVSLSKGDRRAVLIDLDLDGGDLAALLNIKPGRSIADFCENSSHMDAAMFGKCLAEHPSGAALLAAPRHYREISKVGSRGIRKAMSMARSQFPYVVVDMHRSFRTEHAQALFQADIVLLVMRGDYTSVRHATRMLNYVDDLGIDRDRLRVVVNRFDGGGLRQRDIETALKQRIVMTIPENAKHVGRAANRGTPLVVDRPRSPVSHRLLELAGSVNGQA